MIHPKSRPDRPALAPHWLLLISLCALLGCEPDQRSVSDVLSHRILPPQDARVPRTIPPFREPASRSSVTSRPTVPQPYTSKGAAVDDSESQPWVPKAHAATQPTRTLTLAEAIKTAFREQPRLRVYLETLNQAERAREVAFAPYLPTVSGGYGVGTYHLNDTLDGVQYLRTIGIHDSHAVQFADLRLQWLICDFGRRLGRYNQAGINVDIAAQQARRAYQTVANEVAVTYYEVLRARALRKTALDAVRRSQDDVDVALKLEKGGVVEKEKRLRVEVQLAESQRLLDQTDGAEAIAMAALNFAVGLNVNAPTDVQEDSDIPPCTQSLAECLETAVAQRREFRIAQQGIHLADEGQRIAKADFAPRILAEGALVDIQPSGPGRGDLAIGTINLEWTLFEGGARVAQVRIADSKIREAIAQARSVADNIAFQVTTAYQLVITARSGIEHARPAVAQAEENHRLVLARSKVGDATSADITDAESALTRAQSDYLNSIHDFLIALARLEYATGSTATPDNLRVTSN